MLCIASREVTPPNSSLLYHSPVFLMSATIYPLSHHLFNPQILPKYLLCVWHFSRHQEVNRSNRWAASFSSTSQTHCHFRALIRAFLFSCKAFLYSLISLGWQLRCHFQRFGSEKYLITILKNNPLSSELFFILLSLSFLIFLIFVCLYMEKY